MKFNILFLTAVLITISCSSDKTKKLDTISTEKLEPKLDVLSEKEKRAKL